MPPDKKKPPARDRRLSGENVDFAGFDTFRNCPPTIEKQAGSRRRDNFARGMVFQELGYRHGSALDHDGFIDRLPNQSSVATWWRAAP